jgi:predicted ATP-dependent protease
LIPAANVKFLMLREDVVEAVKAGHFHVRPVTTVDEAIELLTGIEAGQPDEEGRFPEGSVNDRVEAHLAALADIRHEFARPAGEKLDDEQSR